MNINTDTMISMTEANQNFSKVARLVDEKGSAVILKNNAPRYLVIDFQQVDRNEALSDADVLAVSRKLMEENRDAYAVLAKMIRLTKQQVLRNSIPSFWKSPPERAHRKNFSRGFISIKRHENTRPLQ